jgi:hypothetical protein
LDIPRDHHERFLFAVKKPSCPFDVATLVYNNPTTIDISVKRIRTIQSLPVIISIF